MRILISLLLLSALCSCGILKRGSSKVSSRQSTDSVFQEAAGKIVILDQISTETRVYGDTLTGGFVLPLDSIMHPVWLESTGLSVGVNAKMQGGRLGLNVTAIAKPKAETQVSRHSEYNAEAEGRTGAVRKNQATTTTQTSSQKWALPWYVYFVGAAALFVLIYQIFKRYIQ